MPSGAWPWLPHNPPQSPPAFPVPIPDSNKAICLPYFDEELVPGTPLWVIGWGYTQKRGEWDSPLQHRSQDEGQWAPSRVPSEAPRCVQANCPRSCSRQR